MCWLENKILEEEKFIGYKVAIKRNNEYYSPAMGNKYKVGQVETVMKQQRLSQYFIEDILMESFSPGMVGRTSVFKYLNDAIEFENLMSVYDSQEYVIIRLTLNNDLVEGKYNASSIVAGRNILKIEEMKSQMIEQEKLIESTDIAYKNYKLKSTIKPTVKTTYY